MTRPLQCLLTPVRTSPWTLEELLLPEKAWTVLHKAALAFKSGVCVGPCLSSRLLRGHFLPFSFLQQRKLSRKGWVAVAQRFGAHRQSGCNNGAAFVDPHNQQKSPPSGPCSLSAAALKSSSLALNPPVPSLPPLKALRSTPTCRCLWTLT